MIIDSKHFNSAVTLQEMTFERFVSGIFDTIIKETANRYSIEYENDDQYENGNLISNP